jgi:hypothetical protein
MCPSTDPSEFAVDVLRKLLHRIGTADTNHEPYHVTHAWTDGTMLYVVYTAPPSDGVWGLARDTSESIIDSGPWPSSDEAALYYYLLDFEENQPSSSATPAGNERIWWFGFSRDGLPARLTDIPETRRHTPTTTAPHRTLRGRSEAAPRRYGNPVGPEEAPETY